MVSPPLEKEFSIMSRVVAPEDGNYSREVAKAILGLGFCEEDQSRMSALVEAAQSRELTDEEQSEAESYRRVESWLVKMKSNARRAAAGQTS